MTVILSIDIAKYIVEYIIYNDVVFIYLFISISQFSQLNVKI